MALKVRERALAAELLDIARRLAGLAEQLMENTAGPQLTAARKRK